MNTWPPKLGGTIHIGRRRWRVQAFGMKDGERWVMATKGGVVNLIPWINLNADQSWAGGAIDTSRRFGERSEAEGRSARLLDA